MKDLFNEENQQDLNRKLRRIAAFFLIVGSMVILIFRGMHGDLPAGDAHASMLFIGEHSFYKGVHLGGVIGAVLTSVGFVALTGSFTSRIAETISRLGVAVVLVGAAVHIFEHSTDGHAGQTLADAWKAASVTDKLNIEHSATTVFTALHGPSLFSISLLWGLGIFLFARALKLEKFPSWLFWIGSIVGALTFIAANLQFLYPDLVPGFIIFGPLVFLVQLWTLALGIVLLRNPRNN
ncbi:hypothetical protein E5161_01710 [Cohnella pontilimi]|uniref:DUF4386 domain-containing protein n=1 Tax=Cohnella pontilimi TaxID=2564100 RepID=A0A4U0FGV2_9BACL|nr:hypothetical protein [Cohnella pontilimi]TJY44138.1 hypothetical protein E5161_01710 [Cohnella pontilimi]